MAQDQTSTSCAHNPAIEQLIESGLECLNQAENTSEDWLYDLYISDARKEFRKAVEIAPDEPWLWFQIGWLDLMDNDEIDDPDPIRTALQRALDLDPDLVAAHVALAYVEAKVSVSRHSNTNEWIEWLDDLRTTGNAMEMLEKQIAVGENLETISASQTQIDELGAELRRTLEGLQQELHQTIWTGPPGEHLRAARERNWHELFV